MSWVSLKKNEVTGWRAQLFSTVTSHTYCDVTFYCAIISILCHHIHMQ